MGEQFEDGISWTDFTLNLWWGCTRIGHDPACGPEPGEEGAVCYAETFASGICGFNDSDHAKGVGKFPIWGQDAKRRYFTIKGKPEEMDFARTGRELKKFFRKFNQPRRPRAFVQSMADWGEGRPEQLIHLQNFWKDVVLNHQWDFLMLTKRAQLIRKLCPYSTGGLVESGSEYLQISADEYAARQVIKRVWQGVTAATQPWLDNRWPFLRDSLLSEQIGWLSLEPMVEKIVLPQDFLDRGKRSWVVVGGQSGSHARAFDPAWARFLRDQCREAGVPLHMKQMSGNTKAALTAIPPDLMIREYPEAA